MLITEGCDNSGKSTFLSQLLPKMLKKLSLMSGNSAIRAQHFGLLPESFDYYNDYLKNISIDAVSDRFHFSELVYGPVLRGHVNPKFDQSRQEMVLLELLVTGSLVVLCDCPMDEIARRFKQRGDEHIDKLVTFEKIADAFGELDFGIPVIEVDTEKPVDDEFLTHIVDVWFDHRQRALEYTKTGGGWGTLEENKLLVIGERPNNDSAFDKTYWPRPFSVPNPIGKDESKISSSTDWVLTMLRRCGLKPKDFHVTNVYHTPTTNESRLADEIKFLQPNRIIVMGHVARNVVVHELGLQNSVPVFDMPHPQYLRRFHQSSFDHFCHHLENFIKSSYRRGDLKEWRP